MSVETQRWFALLIGFICGLLVLAVVEVLSTKDINWPAWIQAVGSIGAIAAAIYVLHKQKQDMLEAEAKAVEMSESRLLIALGTEINVRREQYMERVGNLIAGGKLREIGVFDWEAPDNLFPVYTAMCKDLGLLKDNELRALIIRTYAEMEGLVYSIRLVRNALADAAERDLLHDPQAKQDLQENYETVEDHHALVEALVNSLLNGIQVY
ncbi:hypothetical protein GWQ43_08455 [Alcaligenes faecalis]|uniref:hypothetical protein n=1 Tax=Alcaligenes faecalis TaxID=511 RepID=UPI00137B9FC1|nr:hypothetical protein [Alcaligenes faecalis]QHS36088.1 hypothetical protein GWQ43_08455 [Alcaligenes faecalis]